MLENELEMSKHAKERFKITQKGRKILQNRSPKMSILGCRNQYSSFTSLKIEIPCSLKMQHNNFSVTPFKIENGKQYCGKAYLVISCQFSKWQNTVSDHKDREVAVRFVSSPDPKGHVSYCHHLASWSVRKHFNLLLENH